MINHLLRRDTCRLCGGTGLDHVLHLTPTPLGLDYLSGDQLDREQECYPIDLYLCRDCGYTGMRDVVDAEEIFGENTDVTSMSLGLVEHNRGHVDQVVAYLAPPSGSLVVDIGSNDGTFLTFFRQKGMRVLGVEASRRTAGIANQSGIDTLPKFFTSELASSIKAEHGPAQIVAANRVMANIDDLVDVIEGVRSLLTPDGAFIFETGYLVDLVQNDLFDTIHHEHLGYDSVTPLDGFFRRHRMELIDIQRVTVKGGSIRGVAQHAGGPRPLEPSVAGMKAFEDSVGAGSTRFFEPLATSIERTKSRIASLLVPLAAEGKAIAGYGASIGSTTMIYHLRLGEILRFLVDDDTRNQGLFSPGYHIPVFPSDAIYERNPDYVLILAWRYADAIIRKHQSYLDKGGHFIIPLPELTVV